MRSRRLLFPMLAVCLALLLAAGCVPLQQPAQPAAPGAPAAAQKGGTLTIARPTDAVSLDPHKETTAPGIWVYNNIFESLVVLDRDMKVQPSLAESWQVIDPTRVRFKLRQGVKFHDGTDFNAQAVKFTFDRVLDPKAPARGVSLIGPVQRVEVIDSHTVDVVMKEPYGPIMNAMSLVYVVGIVSPDAVKKFGEDFGRNPVGTGPFKFVEWKTNDRIVIERFDGYWGNKANIDRAVFRVIPEESARMLALQTGEVDFVLHPAPSELPRLRKDPKYVVAEATGLRVVFFGFNLKRAPADDVQVRLAMNAGVNRQAMMEHILEGAAVPARGYLSPGVFGFKDVSASLAYDKAKAIQLLEQAGWKVGSDGVREKGGQKLAMKHLASRGRYLKDAELSENFQAQMKELGIRIDLQFMEWGTLFEQLRSPNIDGNLFTLGWLTVTADADYSLRPLFHSKQLPPTGWNSANYSNARCDELVTKAAQSLNAQERQALYAEAQDILAREAPWVPIYNTLEIAVHGTHVKNFKAHPIEYYVQLWDLWLDKK